MKDVKRLAAAADFHNHPDGYLVLLLEDHDGGPFDLHPKQGDTALYLPSTEAPGYRVAVTGSWEVLDRFGKAILALSRSMKPADADDDASTAADEA